MTVVEPPLTKWIMRRGREANVGRRSLWRQRRLRTSSANPRKVIQHTLSRAAQRYWTNWGGGAGRDGTGRVKKGGRKEVRNGWGE